MKRVVRRCSHQPRKQDFSLRYETRVHPVPGVVISCLLFGDGGKPDRYKATRYPECRSGTSYQEYWNVGVWDRGDETLGTWSVYTVRCNGTDVRPNSGKVCRLLGNEWGGHPDQKGHRLVLEVSVNHRRRVYPFQMIFVSCLR